MNRVLFALTAWLLLVFAGTPPPGRVFGQKSARQSERRTSSSPVRLTISVISRTVCTFPDNEQEPPPKHLGWADFGLELTYVNVSNRRIIFCKGCADGIVPQLFLRLPNGKPGALLYDPIYDRFDYPDPDDLFGDQPDESFLILFPGQKYETTSGAGIPFPLDPSNVGLPQPGDYLLQASVFFGWDFGRKANKFRARWSKFGYLFTDSVNSSLVPISIEKQPDMKPCSK